MLVVGLGNPGTQYELTRHNMGFQTLDVLARRWQVSWRKSPCPALLAKAQVADKEVLLAKPQTYMNASGEAVACLFARLGLGAAELVVVYDDLDLPPGMLRVRQRGSAGGHRGMLSVIQAAGTQEIARVRIGIGRPAPHLDARAYVLLPLTREEILAFRPVWERAADAVECILAEGVAEAMNRYNAG
ncbi:MAG: aminoacyl-tRNA hydrolase [Firmicutes bacterium]|nr:aminoacyl-tRNA hydrolase [Bacillota bacterium]